MSTEAQLQGDSLRRQIERTRQFAVQNGLDLDEEFELKDIGRSAYDGTNLEKGELGRFLEAVRTGRIESGSCLIVESLDRLSRQQPRRAIRVLIDILDAGISVATLIDRRVYRPDSEDHLELMMSVGLMARAYDESHTKSDRVAAAWASKRRRATEKILTAKCKAWLRPLPDRTGFEPVPGRTEIIHRIFAECADMGIGADSIARRLNLDHVAPFGRSKGWQKSYVLKILTDRAVLGEYQPHTRSEGTREQVGQPLPNYYPAVVDEDVFFRAQAALARRRAGGGGRKGARVSNLFSKLARCGICRSRMAFIDKGRRGGTWLICDTARRGMGCLKVPWSYRDFEKAVLTFVDEIDLGALVEGTSAATDIERLQAKVQEAVGRLDDANKKREVILSLMLDDAPTDYLQRKFRDQDLAVADLEASLQNLRADLASALSSLGARRQSAADLNGLIEKIQDEPADDAYRMRSAVQQKLGSLISELLVWPSGSPPNPRAVELIRQLVSERYPDGSLDPETYLTRSKEHRAFWIRFKDNSFRFVSRAPAAPGTYRIFAETPDESSAALRRKYFSGGSATHGS